MQMGNIQTFSVGGIIGQTLEQQQGKIPNLYDYIGEIGPKKRGP